MKYLQNMNHLWKTWWFGCKNTIVTAFILSVYTKLVNGAPQQHHQQGCGHEELVRCAESLTVISDQKELTFVQSKAELDRVCPDMHKGLLCIHSYTRRCMTLNQRDHFHSLYRGTSTVIKDLCKEGPYQEEFLRHLPCMIHTSKEYETCTLKYQGALESLNKPTSRNYTSENDTLKNVCCSFQEYIDCGTKAMRQCGEEAAKFTREFMDRMASNLIKIHCLEYNEERCLSSRSASISSNAVTLTALTAALFVTLRNHILVS